LHDAVFQRGHILLNGGLRGLELRGNRLLRAVELGGCIPAKAESGDSNQSQNNDGGQLPRW